MVHVLDDLQSCMTISFHQVQKTCFSSCINLLFFHSSGFMTTLDANAPGNYGILDVVKVLEFVQEHIKSYRGDPNQVCIA